LDTFVSDAVALARYFEDSLPRRADEAFRKAEHSEATVLVPEVAVGEFAYIALKGRLKVDDPSAVVRGLLAELAASSFMRQVSMTPRAWEAFLESTCKELHDRMIHSMAVALNATAIITNDPEIIATGFETRW